jgi:F0F1-type ATP synthase assembly protein I
MNSMINSGRVVGKTALDSLRAYSKADAEEKASTEMAQKTALAERKQQNTSLGGAVGAVGGYIAGATIGTEVGSMGGPIGMGVGALIGGIAGSLF